LLATVNVVNHRIGRNRAVLRVGADHSARLPAVNRIPIRAREAMYLAAIGVFGAIVGVAFGAIGAVIAALAAALTGAFLRSPATKAADLQVADMEARLARTTRELNDPNHPNAPKARGMRAPRSLADRCRQ
jgi:hypothetical protein